MDNISFGDWIEVAGERPWWLRNGEPYQVGGEAPVFYSRTDPDYYWGGTTCMRVRADHPYYTAKPSTPSNEELTQRMEKLVRGMADDTIDVHAAFHEAQAIVSDLPKPIDPIDEDLLEARELCALDAEAIGDLGLAAEYRAGQNDHRMVRLVKDAVARGRTLAAGGTAHE